MINLGKTFFTDISYTKYSFDLNLGEGLCICTSFHFLDSGLYLLNGFDFYFNLLWMAWHWKPAILGWGAEGRGTWAQVTSLRGLIIGRFSENEPALLPASSLPLLHDRTRGSGVNQAFLPPGSPYGLYTLSQQTWPIYHKYQFYSVCVCVSRTFCLAFVWPNKTAEHGNAGSTMGFNLAFVTLSQGASRLFFLFSRHVVSNRSYRTFSKASGLSKPLGPRNGDQRTEL